MSSEIDDLEIGKYGDGDWDLSKIAAEVDRVGYSRIGSNEPVLDGVCAIDRTSNV